MLVQATSLQEACQQFGRLTEKPGVEICWIFETKDGQFFVCEGRSAVKEFDGFAKPIIMSDVPNTFKHLTVTYLDHAEFDQLFVQRGPKRPM